jgi:hypothetical protein
MVMNENRKIDFQKHQLPKFKKLYLLKIIFYVLILIGLIIYIGGAIKKNRSAIPAKIEVKEFELQE